MMNKILRNMINKGKVAAFMDDILVGMEMEERHDKIVEEVLKQLEENDLYVKPEKCVEGAEGTIFGSSDRRRKSGDERR